MPHQRVTHKLGRNTGQRRALLKSLTRSLVLHERITTTEARAKALRPVVERFITWGCKAAMGSVTPLTPPPNLTTS